MTMENMNIVTAEQQAPNTISATNSIFNVQALTQLQAVAGLMAQAAVTVPEHLRGNPADCMAIIMQAMQWGMNPYAVAQKTHLVNGVLGYEAQLVNAVISSSNAIVGRFHYEYEGDWSKCARIREEVVKKPAKGGGTYEKKKLSAAGPVMMSRDSRFVWAQFSAVKVKLHGASRFICPA